MAFTFTKEGYMKYISHLDLMRLFMRAFRRAGLPLKMSEGFNPHPKLSISRALKLGVESENEQAMVILKTAMRSEDFIAIMNRQLPIGIHLTSAQLELI